VVEQLEHLKHLELPRSVFCLALNGCDLQRFERREAVERFERLEPASVSLTPKKSQ
jgi:hypothetical protein